MAIGARPPESLAPPAATNGERTRRPPPLPRSHQLPLAAPARAALPCPPAPFPVCTTRTAVTRSIAHLASRRPPFRALTIARIRRPPAPIRPPAVFPLAAAAVFALLALAASPVSAKSANSCMSAVSCTLPAVWSEWSAKFNVANFSAADGGWSQALALYLNPEKVEHWLDEYHMEAGCCEFWRCNNDTNKCTAPASGAGALAAPALLLAALAVAQLLL